MTSLSNVTFWTLFVVARVWRKDREENISIPVFCIMFVAYFVCGLFNDAVSSSGAIA
jgi:hypothetical protein